MIIDWRSVQRKLLAAGYEPGMVDGIPGADTYAALLAHQVQRDSDATLRGIAGVASVILPVYGWAERSRRLAEWIAETAHETGGYAHFEENLNYTTAERLMQIWPSRFPTVASAHPFVRNPKALAIKVYGDRMGNRPGTEDGWMHRGSGLLHHTGAAEYAKLHHRLGFLPDDVRNPAKAVIAACDYLLRVKAQNLADAGDWHGVRKAINGGLIGIDDVAERRNRTLAILQ